MDWRPIENFEKYKINPKGDIRSIRDPSVLLKGYARKNGRHVALYKDKKPYYFKISNLVDKTFSE
jgi:hypothetical protein